MNANFECRFPYVLLESPRGLGSVLLGCGCQEYKHVTYKCFNHRNIWVRSRRCGCLVTWFCYQLVAKPGNKTAALPWPDPYICCDCFIFARSIIHLYSNFIIIMTAICKNIGLQPCRSNQNIKYSQTEIALLSGWLEIRQAKITREISVATQHVVSIFIHNANCRESLSVWWI